MREKISATLAKTDLHLHLEGALTPDRALRLAGAAKHVPLMPAGGVEEGAHGRRWAFRDLGGFLRLFGWGTRLLRGPESYGALLTDLLTWLRLQEVEYAEVFVAVGQMLRTGHDPRPILPHLAELAHRSQESGGPEVWFVADATRQWGAQAAEAVLDVALECRDSRIVGFGMGGDETAVRAREFRRTFRRAADYGLQTSCHAGEGTHPDAVREVVEELEVRRIGHGIAAVEDHGLLRELADARVVLEVCPTSNWRTGAWHPDRGPHPVLALLAAEVPVVLGCDDPAFFGSSLPGEFALLRDWGVDETRLREIEDLARTLRRT